MDKKYILSFGLVAVVLVGATSLVLAENMQDQAVVSPVPVNAKPMVLEVGPRGNVLLRGTVSAVGTGSLTVKSWGGDWTVNVSAATKFAPATSMDQFKAGDFVGVQGSMSTVALWTVDATLVRNWTTRKDLQATKDMVKRERHNNMEEIREVMLNESPKNWQGTASNINATAKTLTLTVDGTAYAVSLVTDAKVVDRAFFTIDFAKVKEGDTVRVWGPVSSDAISAYVLRDVSVGSSSGDLNKR